MKLSNPECWSVRYCQVREEVVSGNTVPIGKTALTLHPACILLDGLQTLLVCCPEGSVCESAGNADILRAFEFLN
jgi:hypothetical protein